VTDDRKGSNNEFQRAVDRLEQAVEQFVGSANEHLSHKATRFLDDAADRLEREARRRQARAERRAEAASTSAATDTDDASYGGYDHEREDAGREDSRYESRRSRRRHRRRQRRSSRYEESREPGYRTTRLYRDTRRAKIGGVCAGLARYFGVETWVVRCVAITGVIFMPSIVIPAYFIGMFVIPKIRNGEPKPELTAKAHDHRSPAPELGAKFSPRHSLRGVQAELDQVELKLRRMESYVTSGQYELQRELKRIDA